MRTPRKLMPSAADAASRVVDEALRHRRCDVQSTGFFRALSASGEEFEEQECAVRLALSAFLP